MSKIFVWAACIVLAYLQKSKIVEPAVIYDEVFTSFNLI